MAEPPLDFARGRRRRRRISTATFESLDLRRIPRLVLPDLKAKKLMDGFQCGAVPGGDSHPRARLDLAVAVSDLIPQLAHLVRAVGPAIVHCLRLREVAGREIFGDHLQMMPDGIHAP